MATPEKSLTIGWYMSAKKIIQLQWNSFVAYVEERGHKAIALDLAQDYSTISPRPELDLILLKMTDELVKVDVDPYAANLIANARKLVQLYPNAVLVDPIESQILTIDRESMHQFFEQVNALPQEMQLRCPRGKSLLKPEDKSELPPDFAFPAMVKSLQASGSLAAHDMAVVWKLEDVDKFKYPLYIQEYMNHDGTIFKIYVLGEHTYIVTRVSLPNFPKEYQTPVLFNSQDWKHELPAELTKEYTGKRKQPAAEVIAAAARSVSSLLGLSLFGFDVIENVDDGKLAIIDVNYFPDYRGVADIFPKLLAHLKWKASSVTQNY